MKRLIFTLLCALLALTSTAQNAKNILEIDPSSFRLEQSGVLTGVNIDNIGTDRSKRPCARVKMRIHRMPSEDMQAIEVKLPSGDIELVKQIVSFEGTGIVFDLTARADARLYLSHPKYFQSNEVSISLEPNKVYLIDAELKELITIFVQSNVEGAAVYVDDTYKGKTDQHHMLKVSELEPGTHTIKVKHGAYESVEQCEVNISSTAFRVDVSNPTLKQQIVEFKVEPSHATVYVDGKPLPSRNGTAMTTLYSGSYKYRITAEKYFEQSDTFTVADQAVEKVIKLKADDAAVVISSSEESQIWVDGELKGDSPWSGRLFAGEHILEARKANHRPTSISQTILSRQGDGQRYELAAPTPILANLRVLSEPAQADVSIDGIHIGQTPLTDKILIGEHTLLISKNGYVSWQQKISIVAEEENNFTASLSTIESHADSNRDSQYVVFEVEPKDATVTIDNNDYKANNGYLQILLPRNRGYYYYNNRYSYYVRANEYHTHYGEFTLQDEIVRKEIALKPEYVRVRFNITPKNASIYINNQNLKATDGVVEVKLKADYDYKYTISADNYHTLTGALECNNEAMVGNTITKEISLESKFTTVTFEVEPKDATIKIDNESYKAKDGLAEVLLMPNGRFHYLICDENDHYTQKEGYVNTSQRSVHIKATLERKREVIVSAGGNAEIWIDDVRKGSAPWRGYIEAGEHRFEARKEGHANSVVNKRIEISATPVEIKLESPTPKYGTLSITAKPKKAEIKIDGVSVGNSLYINKNTLATKHTVAVTKKNYTSWHRTVDIKENTTTTLVAKLKRLPIVWKKNNIGFFADAQYLCKGTFDSEEVFESDTCVALFGGGICWRPFEYDKLINLTVGVRYLISANKRFQCIGIPIVANINYKEFSSCSIFLGVGFEPTVDLDNTLGTIKYRTPFAMNLFGVSSRHHDFQIYSNFRIWKGKGELSFGCRYTFYL